MEEQFVTYEIALKLKELGFDEECFAFFLTRNDLRIKEYKESGNKNSAFYNNTVCSAPIWQQVIDWFRKKYNIYISIIPHGENEHALKIKSNTSTLIHGGYKKYEEARKQAILKAIELCKTN